MGNNNSIEINEIPNGIYDIKVKGIPDYPIAYLRLYWDFEKNKYCVLEDCDIDKNFSKKRKMLVVGMNLPDQKDIVEQVFYLSSGYNSIETLQSFFNEPLNIEKDDNDINLWLPFFGIGYDSAISKNMDFNTNIKIMKDYFDCTTKGPVCLYGRFGRYDPNLMQISYCLGGKFWDDNIFLINKDGYDIKKYPTLSYLINQIPCVSNNGKTIIECSTYINNYIASAIPLNYVKPLIESRKKNLKYRKNTPYFNYEDIKADWRILKILNDKKIREFQRIFGYKSLIGPLPFENAGDYSSNFWMSYYTNIDKLYKEDEKYFIENVVPLINQKIPIPDYKIIDKKVFTEDVPDIEKIVIKDFKENKNVIITETIKSEIKGGIDNPHEKREDAKIGDYYKHGKRVLKKNK